MANQVEVDLHVEDVTSHANAIEVVTKAIDHLNVVIEKFRNEQISDAITAMGNALSCIDEVQDYLERITGGN